MDDFITIVEGCCSSAATLLSIAGNDTYIMRNSMYMIHQLCTEFSGTWQELQVDLENSNNLMKSIMKIYCDNSQLTKAQLLKHLSTDSEMTAHETIQHGLVDRIWEGKYLV